MTDISVMEVGCAFLHSGCFPCDYQPRFGSSKPSWTPVGCKIVKILDLDKMEDVSQVFTPERLFVCLDNDFIMIEDQLDVVWKGLNEEKDIGEPLQTKETLLRVPRPK